MSFDLKSKTQNLIQLSKEAAQKVSKVTFEKFPKSYKYDSRPVFLANKDLEKIERIIKNCSDLKTLKIGEHCYMNTSSSCTNWDYFQKSVIRILSSCP